MTDIIDLPADEETVESIRKMTKNNVKLVTLETARGKRLAGLHSILIDLDWCIKACDLCLSFKHNPPEDIDKLLLLSFIITYAKCFTEGGVQLNRKDHVPDRFLKTHDGIMDIRNNYVAHSGNSEYETRVVYLTLALDTPKPKIKAAFPEIKKLRGVYVNDWEHFHELTISLKENVQKAADKSESKFFDWLYRSPPEVFYDNELITDNMLKTD